MSYERMEKEKGRLKEEIRGLVEQAEAVDEAEDGEYGAEIPTRCRRS